MESEPNRTKYEFDFDRSILCYRHLNKSLVYKKPFMQYRLRNKLLEMKFNWCCSKLASPWTTSKLSCSSHTLIHVISFYQSAKLCWSVLIQDYFCCFFWNCVYCHGWMSTKLDWQNTGNSSTTLLSVRTPIQQHLCVMCVSDLPGIYHSQILSAINPQLRIDNPQLILRKHRTSSKWVI
jgi:hypothetical protein